MRKFTKSESVEVLSPEQHKAVEKELNKLGKTSAKSLNQEERDSLNSRIAQSK